MRVRELPSALILAATALACGGSRRDATPPAAPPPHPDFRGELVLNGVPETIGSTPSGRIWLGTANGTTYLADSVNGEWTSLGELPIDTGRALPPAVPPRTENMFVTADRRWRADGETWAFGYVDGREPDQFTITVFRSRDFGRSWTTASTVAATSPPGALSFASARDALLAAMDNGLFLSHDGARRGRRSRLRSISISTSGS